MKGERGQDTNKIEVQRLINCLVEHGYELQTVQEEGYNCNSEF